MNLVDFSCYGQTPILILEHPTGVKYGGQVGGMACLHPAIEGIALPLSKFEWEGLESVGCKHGACWGETLNNESAVKLQTVWPHEANWMGVPILFDTTRLDQGTEAWYPVRMGKLDYDTVLETEWLQEKLGFLLMYDNCD